MSYTVTYQDKTYTCDIAYKGTDYIKLVNKPDNINVFECECVALFEGVLDVSLFEIKNEDGESFDWLWTDAEAIDYVALVCPSGRQKSSKVRANRLLFGGVLKGDCSTAPNDGGLTTYSTMSYSNAEYHVISLSTAKDGLYTGDVSELSAEVCYGPPTEMLSNWSQAGDTGIAYNKLFNGVKFAREHLLGITTDEYKVQPGFYSYKINLIFDVPPPGNCDIFVRYFCK